MEATQTDTRLVFREVNERLRELSKTFSSEAREIDVVCECGQAECTERFRMSVDAYDLLRRDRVFVMKAEHAFPDGRVVERQKTYVVVSRDD